MPKYYRVTKWMDTVDDCMGWYSHMINKSVGCAIVQQTSKPKRFSVFVNGTEVGDAIQRKEQESVEDHKIHSKHNFNH